MLILLYYFVLLKVCDSWLNPPLRTAILTTAWTWTTMGKSTE